MDDIKETTVTEEKKEIVEQYKKLLFIVNPKAGQKKREDILVDVINIFNDYGYEVLIKFTRREKHAIEIVKALGSQVDMIACMGGDGTLNEVMAGMRSARLKKPLGYIPAGSTNDFANSLNLPSDPVEAAKHMVTHKAKYIDIGKFNDRYFVYTASAGIFTKASYSAPQNIKNMLGHFAYVLEGVKDLTQVKRMKLEIENEDEVIEGEYIFVAICNATSIGGVMTIDEGKVDFADGLFELLLIKYPKDLIELGIIINELTNQIYDKHIRLLKVSKLKISDSSDIDWSLDGEKEDGRKNMKFRVIHNAVKLVY
ncbi:YegS/Rv2252/BmrU family lipid kinase [Eubacterium sp. LFL-14]|uniref:YegS/Rv2252/BmrU family lipid kinase n=1 Tax=Eubacterium album TaxID=2978477 RepID=A0ABT2LYB3_9FIRM|nr:YegS/Rv2252/BmrU family lipid kinase [Eubacterium sp. LFL-14]MCT7398278.1 YegS/Rv2252/BmrU family lipid kinase [Eubacterium sp. LFL-14]